MFSILESWFNAFVLGYVANVSGALAAALVPVAAALVTVYVILYGFAVMRGEVTEPLSVFAWKAIKVAAILAFALPGLYYNSYVTSTAIGLQNGLAVLLTASGASAASTAFGALDAVNAAANAELARLWSQAGMLRLDLVFASLLFSLGTTVFLVIGCFVALLGRLVLTFGLSIGPLAILCLLFKPTARFFDSWVSFLLSAIVLSWFVFFALGMSLFVSNRVITAITTGGAFVGGALVVGGTATVGAIEAAGTYLVVMVLLGIILWQAPSLASSLTGGASVQAGTQMLSNTMLAVRAGRSGGAGGSSAGTATNSIGKGAPASYAAGRAIGMAGRAITGGGRPAYQRAALRGGGSSKP